MRQAPCADRTPALGPFLSGWLGEAVYKPVGRLWQNYVAWGGPARDVCVQPCPLALGKRSGGGQQIVAGTWHPSSEQSDFLPYGKCLGRGVPVERCNLASICGN